MRPGAVTVLCLVQFVDVLGVTSVVTAIPDILRGLHAGAGAAGPVATTYAMFFGAMLVLGARLGDRYGHRRVLLVGIVAFGLVSVVGGTATDIPQLLVARAVQGAAAAVSAPCALRLLLHVAQAEPARTRALAAWSAVGAAAGATGFLVGGVLTTTLGWSAVFWVNAPVALLLVAGVLAVVRSEPEDRDRRPLDVLGAVLLVAAVMPLVAGAALLESAGTRAAGAGLLAVALVLGAGFAWRIRTARAPLVPPAAVASRNLRRGTVQSFVNTAATSSASVLATLVLQDDLGLSALVSGLTLMTFSIAVVVGSTVTGSVAAWLGPDRLAAVGLGLIALGDGVLALTLGTWWGIVAGIAVAGLGIALSSVAATGTGTDVPRELAGSAAGVVNTGAQLGTAIGTAGVVLVAAVAGTAAGWASAAAAAALCAVWCALRPAGHARAVAETDGRPGSA